MSFTASSINAGLQCPKLYKFKYIDGYRAGESTPMKIGTLVHKGLEAYWLGKDLSNALMDMQDVYMEDDWWTSGDGLIAYVKCRAYIHGYYKKYYKQDPLRTFINPTTVWTEKEFKFTWADVTFKGKLDVLVIDHKLGTARVIEHKTTGTAIEVGGVYFDRLPMDVQCTIYRQAALEILNENPSVAWDPELPEVHYDVIGTSRAAPKQKKKIARRKNETDEALENRKADNQETINEFEERMVETYEWHDCSKYIRHEVPCTMMQHTNRLTELVEYVKLLENREFLEIRNSTACGSYGGCSFVDICLGRGRLNDSAKLVKLEDSHPELDGKGNNYVSYDAEGAMITNVISPVTMEWPA